MPSSLPALPQFQINGPFWSADAELLRFSHPTLAWDMRALFVDLSTRDYTEDKSLLPGTLIVLCWVRTVRIQPDLSDTAVYTFTRASGQAPPPGTLSLVDIKQYVFEGKISLLLVQADPAQWKSGAPSSLGTVTCLAGDISLDALRGASTSRPALFRALDLLEATLGERPGAAALPGALCAHATGLTLYGQARLPWESGRIAAPYQLARVMPDPKPPSGETPQRVFRLTPEFERLTSGERAALRAAWGRMATSIDPGNPAIAVQDPFVPRWVTLEVANPGGIPKMYWLASPWQAEPGSLALHLEREELNLVLSDQALFDQAQPTTSLARTVLDDVQLTRTESSTGGAVTVTLTLHARRPGTTTDPKGKLSYAAEAVANRWRETFTLSELETAYQPVETARLLRDEQELPVPSWGAGAAATPVEPPVLWAFMPLEDGWAQLPVPNLTEQMYLDARLARQPESAPALLSGAVIHGNDKPGTLEEFPSEQPWSLTLLDAGRLSGTWTLSQQSATQPLKLTGVALQLFGPEVVLNGLLWVATGKPTPADALPTVDDWASGLRSLSLRTVDPSVDVLPPLMRTFITKLAFELRTPKQSHPSALLGPWALSLHVDVVQFKNMVKDLKLLPTDTFCRYRPLLWRRHRTLPMVQALPLTQSLTPPSHPSASRQFVPFELSVAEDTSSGLRVPAEWHFGRTVGNGAAVWPIALGTTAPAREWATLADLPLVSLSLPGLVLDPGSAGRTGLPAETGMGLPQQYRHDLPYADEVHALAQLPRVPRQAAEVSPLPVSPRPELPKPLTREALDAHFSRLSERASLAAADAVVASAMGSGGPELRSLVEPLAWPVSATLEAQSYPGALTLANAPDAPVKSLRLEAEDALKGLTGSFLEVSGGRMHLVPTPTPGAYELTAGSMAAHTVGNGTFRDQRGLLRGATTRGMGVLRTPVRLAESPEAIDLTSLLAAVPLWLGPGAAQSELSWQLWFRDLPVFGQGFSRTRTRSALAQDVNDPEAGSRGLNHLNGWEWRLEPNPSGRYTLYGLDFHPLTFEAATFVGDELRHVELVGRLQLPVSGGGENDALANAVLLTFDWDEISSRLVLSAVQARSTRCEWPLAFSSGQSGDAPRLEWSQIALTPSKDRLEVTGARLIFQLFGADWSISLAPLGFGKVPTVLEHRYTATGAAASEPLPPREVRLSINPVSLEHRVSLLLGVRLGRGVATMPTGPRSTPLRWEPGQGVPLDSLLAADTVRTAFAGEVRFHLLGPEAGRVSWESGFLFDDMRIAIPGSDPSKPEESPLIVGEGALQFRWRTYDVDPDTHLQLLPGMHVVPGEAPGFTALAFRLLTASKDVPTLSLASSFVEVLLQARWGEFLQDSRASSAPSLTRVFGSSAGEVVFGYTGESRGASWDEHYLLNGFLEVKDLVSWPLGMTLDTMSEPTSVGLTLPGVRPAPELRHLRHTLRILFDQHVIPPGTLETSPEELLFQFAPGKDWRLLAVVEHQLVDVLPTGNLTALTLQNDRRWVVVQEVRFLSPARLAAGLRAQQAVNLRTPEGTTAPLGDASFGHLGSGVRALLAEGSSSVLDALAADTLLVEASAVHWLKELPLTASAATALQYLPSGTQLATLSSPDDYSPTDPRAPAWALLQMPFLGRMQDQDADAIQTPATTPPLLRSDPVLELQRRRSSAEALPSLLLALTAWADSAAVSVRFSNFDAAVGRTWARLDPRALEESWFYLQKPTREPPPVGLQSVLASLPDTPARLGRPVTLGLLYQGGRKFYPPAADPGGERSWTEPPSEQSGHLQVLQASHGAPSAETRRYGWLVTGLQLLSGLLARAGSSGAGTRHHAAATVVPMAGSVAPVPGALAVSPFLSLEFQPAPPLQDTELRISVAELLCLDAATGRLRPVASQNWELNESSDVRKFAATWARETHLRLSPESPVAVLRFREVRQSRVTGSSADSRAVLVTRYDFGLVPGIEPRRTLAKRVFRLRSSVKELRFRDGRFGGSVLPVDVRSFEVAPPQMVGVQPLHLSTRPAAKTVEARWPWGLSALRTSTQYTDKQEGVAGRLEDSTAEGISLWWQALQHGVQFRSGLSEAPAAGLPSTFRSVAIRGLLPVLPNPPLPKVDGAWLLNGGALPLSRWQPVLPGAVRTMLVGTRPGVLVSMRHQLLRQSGIVPQPGTLQYPQALVSGSVPVQHRAPRPVPLPASRADARDTALRPWASRFEPDIGLLARSSPADEAFFAAFGTEPAHRLQVKIVYPSRGGVSIQWDGSITVDVALDGALARIEDWNLVLQIEHGGRFLRYPMQKPATGGSGRYHFQLVEASSEVDTLRAILQDMRAGDVLVVKALVRRVQGTAGFFQTLTFPFRFQDEKALQLPLEPFFILFEDPEYNRQLASSAKHATGVVATMDNGRQALHTVTLATDRTEYDPDGQLALRYDWDDNTTAHSAFVSIDLLDATGVSRPLRIESGFQKQIQMTVRTLRQISLLELTENQVPVRLVGGEALSIKLSITAGIRGVIAPITLVLTVDVRIEPVIPAPQAAYALLRRQLNEGQTQVECVRFAWSPPANRIELVCPDDLRTGLVRRRAVFLWTDTARTLAAQGYAVQKITLTGSTHFPTPNVLERVTDTGLEGGPGAVHGWVLTTSVRQTRQGHSATQLGNGKVLVVGGYGSTSELYDPPTGSWTLTGETTAIHRNHTATKLRDGRILIAGGGQNANGTVSAELYDPVLARWISAGRLGQLRFNHTATLLPDGKVLVTGGRSTRTGTDALATAELYEPPVGTATGAWRNTGSMGTVRRLHTATLLNNGMVLIVGGNNGSAAVSTAELYNPLTHTFALAAPMKVARSQHTATLLANGQVLVTGGPESLVDGGASAELYDPDTNTWSDTGRMSKPRGRHTAALLASGKVLVAGGYHDFTGIQSDAELYDPTRGAWSSTSGMKVSRCEHTATQLSNGTVLVVGGISPQGQNPPQNPLFAEFYVS